MWSGRFSNTEHVDAEASHLAPHLRADPLLALGLGHGLGGDAHAAGEEKLNSSTGSRPSLVMILVQSRNEKSSLSFSNSDRHTFWYSEYVKCSAMIFNRSSRSTSAEFGFAESSSSDSSAEAWIERTNSADEPGQRVLVHGVDVRQVADGEEQHRVVRSARLVPLSRGVNLNLRSLGDDLLLGDLVGYDLRLLEGLDARGVVEDVTLGRRKRVQDAVLDVLEALLVIRGFHDELLALRLQVGSLLRHDHAQELIAQAVGVIMKLRSVTFTAVSGR